MKPANDLLADMLDLGSPGSLAAGERVWRSGAPAQARVSDGDVLFDMPFRALRTHPHTAVDDAVPPRSFVCRVRALGDSVVRLSIAFGNDPVQESSPMLELGPDAAAVPLSLHRTAVGWEAVDPAGHTRLHVGRIRPALRPWSSFIQQCAAEPTDITVLPDGVVPVEFQSEDHFVPGKVESLPMGFVTQGPRMQPARAAFSLCATAGEHYAGTGERFARMDLSGQTLVLENTDALGVNNRRAYKNVPFVLSSRGYGLFLHTSAHLRLSLAGVSTRSVQGAIDEPLLDLFYIGGGSLERVLYHYRSLTGFPAVPPAWSYGTWMSRMTYFSADEVRTVGHRLREEGCPCDVLHIDTGWFAKDWVCEWTFSPERFPDPAGFMADMRRMGYRVSLWQNPNLGTGNRLLPEARKRRYVPPALPSAGRTSSDFSGQDTGGQIDFSNPEAVAWYRSLLRDLFRAGASVIKTDFGEDIDMNADFQGMPASKLHNLYGLLYQRAAFEETRDSTGEPLIWARSAWAGCQRYPVHWGGDAASTWDGMAASLRGGLHFGLSGFAFWSCDVPGFHGLPEFMSTWPTDTLYVRWTQMAVFLSHLRYHGASPREPYEYPAIADIVRRWLRLRYALIPYLIDQGNATTSSGYPVVRALALHHSDDPACWQVDDQFYCGGDLMVAPVMNDEGVRNVYLPEGEWVDLWNGEVLAGPRLLRSLRVPLERTPVYARRGSEMRVYPERVDCVDHMDLGRSEPLRFDQSYRGLASSVLARVSGLT